ncbi:hypothetical protein CAPTEDRAFT_214262 [Capitella teleta]|uniref:Fringe-like glycosyltransferase domain-containing protein n=1 Tax=Capitella teleta TaxID=283909 RepID=R7UZ84_CAPTE|nr:hypothetical protein CAPTEDRAFT_214262 [Capitella teleta]|eukprot:ELU08731.1 hypothetical protein CAPTEDRAFT_214262 [Capitella teleta]
MRCKVRKLCKTLSGLCLLFVVHVFLSFFVLNSDSEDAQQVVERHPSIQKRSLGDDEAGAGFLFDSLIPAANRRISELHPGDIPRRVRKLGNSVKVLRPKEETELQDVYISVKTTRKYHRDRLDLLLKTWVMFAQDVLSKWQYKEEGSYWVSTATVGLKTLKVIKAVASAG